jgi:hypothetical protein
LFIGLIQISHKVIDDGGIENLDGAYTFGRVVEFVRKILYGGNVSFVVFGEELGRALEV